MPRKPSRIYEELQQTRPFPSLAAEAAVGILKTADVLRRAGSRLLAPHGLTLQQYNVLRILRGAGDQGLATLEIAGRLIEEAPGITRLLDRLEEKNLIRRERRLADRRQVLCFATPEGLALLTRLDRPILGLDEGRLKHLDDARLRKLIDTLDGIREASG